MNVSKAVLPPLAPRAWLRWDVVSRIVAELAPATILEIGCGQGAFGSRFAASHDYLGVEPDPTSFALAEPRVTGNGGTIIRGRHDQVPAGRTFDLVCAFEVLEHLDDDRSALKEWTDYVAPGGRLMLSVPAFQSRFGPMDVEAGHFRRYGPDQLAELMTSVGLQAPDVTVYGWPLGYALEVVRNRVASRREPELAGRSAAELTAASGRILQPSKKLSGTISQVGTLPFRQLQRLKPNAGTGLVAVAQRSY